jgi:MFS family permease
LLIGFGLFGSSAILSQYFQVPASSGYGLGADATHAGLFLVPGTALMLFVSPLAGRLGARAGARTSLIVGCVLAVVALGCLAVAGETRAEAFALPTLLYLGTAFAYAAIPALVLDAVPQARSGEATSFNQVLRGIGSSLGTQAAAVAITASVVVADQPPARHGFTVAFVIQAIACLGALIIATRLPARTVSTGATVPAGTLELADAELLQARDRG